MKKIVVFSDLHGDVNILRLVIARAEKEKAELILFAGDLGIHHSTLIAHVIRNSSIPFLMVRGNCDSPWAFVDSQMPIPPRYLKVQFGPRIIFTTHGDIFSYWKDSPEKLSKEDVFITGHTHVAMLAHDHDSPYLLNPGSASRPRDEQEPSFALITEEGIFIQEILSGITIKGLSVSFR